MTIYFYSTREAFGEFSNFSSHGFELDGKFWKTSEHYFQAKKFAGTEYEEKVRLASSPKEAATMGRDRSFPLRPDWEEVKIEIMERAVHRKFESHPELKSLLLQTGSEEIVENARGDFFWGSGADGTGRNELGKLLMRLRAKLKGNTI